MIIRIQDYYEASRRPSPPLDKRLDNLFGANQRTAASSLTKPPSIELDVREAATVRTKRLLLAGALLRLGDHRLLTRSSCRESSRTRDNVSRGSRRRHGRTGWQKVDGMVGITRDWSTAGLGHEA